MLANAERSHLWRLAVLGVAVLMIGVSFAWVISEILERRDWPAFTDMELYLHAASQLAAGIDPYADSVDALHRYPYPPLFADLLALLVAIFGRMGAAWLWIGLGGVFALTAIWTLMRGCGFRVPIHWTIFAAGVVMLGHVGRADLMHGQINFFLFALLALGFAQWRQGNTRAASVLWAVMICCKPFLGIVVFFLLRRADWRAAIWTLGLSAVIFAASFLPTFPNVLETLSSWRQVSQFYSSPAYASNPLDQSFYGLALRLFTANEFSQPWVVAPILAPIMLLLVGAVAFTAFFINASPANSGEGDERAPRIMLQFGAALAALMGLGPVTEGDHLFYILPGVIGVLVIAWRRVQSGVNWKLWLGAAAAWAPVTAYIAWPKQSLVFFAEPSTWVHLNGAGVLLSGACGISLLLAAIVTAFAFETERRAPVTRSGELAPAQPG
jgi:hypothetical protein